MIDRHAYRQKMLAHCMALAQLGHECAMAAADWYEENEPWHLDGLGARVRKQLSAKGAK